MSTFDSTTVVQEIRERHDFANLNQNAQNKLLTKIAKELERAYEIGRENGYNKGYGEGYKDGLDV